MTVRRPGNTRGGTGAPGQVAVDTSADQTAVIARVDTGHDEDRDG